jgi:2-dehydropantoate 2-reductase|tara:strand:- start:477 stop:1379 length:903 start_codon:yes stop_codon:yes gene_type:complete
VKILILGAGAIGGFFGAHLMKSGANVSFLVREKRKDELKKSGINIFSINGELKVNPKLLDKNLSGQHFDVIILTNKSYDLIESIREIKPYVNKTVIIPLLNGMAHYEILDKEFGKEKIFGGTAYISTAMNNYGSIQQITSRASIKFGPRTQKNINIANEFYEICKETEFECDFSDHIELDLWRKYVLIGATAASTVLFQKPLGEICATTYGKRLIIEIHEECKKIVLSKGYDIGIEATNYNLKLITDKDSLLKASMLRDFESGKKTECEHILGYLIELAKRNNVQCNLIKAAHTRIQVGL